MLDPAHNQACQVAIQIFLQLHGLDHFGMSLGPGSGDGGFHRACGCLERRRLGRPARRQFRRQCLDLGLGFGQTGCQLSYFDLQLRDPILAFLELLPQVLAFHREGSLCRDFGFQAADKTSSRCCMSGTSMINAKMWVLTVCPLVGLFPQLVKVSLCLLDTDLFEISVLCLESLALLCEIANTAPQRRIICVDQ